MILDKNNETINIGDKVKNLDNGKEFIFTEEIENILHHYVNWFKQNCEINKTSSEYKYDHLVKI